MIGVNPLWLAVRGVIAAIANALQSEDAGDLLMEDGTAILLESA